MQQYGSRVWYGTGGINSPVQGICQNFTATEQGSTLDEPDENGDHAAHILYDLIFNLSWRSKVLGNGKIPIIGNSGGCKVTVTDYVNVLLQSVTETGGNNKTRELQMSAVSYPDLGTGATGAMASEQAVVIPPNVGGLVYPLGKVLWGTPDTKTTLGLIQEFSVTQQVKHNPHSEDGKIRNVVVNGFEITFDLSVIAYEGQAAPRVGDELTLTQAPPVFQASNFITSARREFTIASGVVYAVSSRWTPALLAQ